MLSLSGMLTGGYDAVTAFANMPENSPQIGIKGGHYFMWG